MTTTNARRSYTPAFKADAVARLRAGDTSVTALAEELGVAPGTLRNWAKAAPEAVPVSGAEPHEMDKLEALVEASPAQAPATAPDACTYCGRQPSAQLKIRSGTGMVFLSQWRKIEGRYCRDCGSALATHELNRTMTRGWFGIVSFFMNWYAVALDVIALRKAKALPSATGTAIKPPVAAGAPLWKRAGLYVTVAVLVVVGGYGVREVTKSEAAAFGGKCITVDVTTNKVKAVGCDEDHVGKVVAVVNSLSECPEGVDGTLRLKIDGARLLCVDRDL